MMDKIKTILAWITLPALVFGAWGTFVSWVVGFDTVYNTVSFLVTEQFNSGMTGYEIMELIVRRFAIEEGLVE